MPRSDKHRNAAALIALVAVAASLTGCASSSRTTLGLNGGSITIDGMGAGDALGAAMFQEQVRLAAAESRRQRLLRTEMATVSVPVD
jgi:hypothetical protein